MAQPVRRWVKFPEFRTHQEVFAEMNTSIMGLLAGSQLAAHLLRLTEGSEHTLAQVFPRVPHISRFDLKTGLAQSVLDAAESHLGFMAIPYVLGIHEDYLKTCLRLVQRKKAERIKAYRQHEELQKDSPIRFQSSNLEQYHLLRLMRNCLVHAHGEVSPELTTHVKAMSATAKGGWAHLTGRPFAMPKPRERLAIGHVEIIAALAVTKNLARRANEILQALIARSAWLVILADDLTRYGGTLPRGAGDLRRKVSGYARHHYSALRLSENELEQVVNLLQLQRGAAEAAPLREADSDT